ncbi:MAG: PhoX family phosphatase [Maricaulaceae bacterium]
MADLVPADSLTFTPIPVTTPELVNTSDTPVVPEGYGWAPVLVWGQSLSPFVPDMDSNDITNDASSILNNQGNNQAFQFGYNCDAAEFFPLPSVAGQDRGIICVNHEFLSEQVMFPTGSGVVGEDFEVEIENTSPTGAPTIDATREFFANPANEGFYNTAIGALGFSIAEIRRNADGLWELVRTSRFNRRITLSTPIAISGPAAGNALLQTSQDPTGTVVLGTYNNCAAGGTPYGTYLSCEENVNGIFANFGTFLQTIAASDDPADIRALNFFLRQAPDGFSGGAANASTGFDGFGGGVFFPPAFGDRYDVAIEPNEQFRFGWVVETNPFDPTSTPVKRTALGRCKHECATTIIATGGQMVVYMGDDARFEYVYKFVTNDVITGDVEQDFGVLDNGILYAAQFNADGTGVWLPIDINDPVSGPILQAATAGIPNSLEFVPTTGIPSGSAGIEIVGGTTPTDIPLFETQGDVLMGTRLAADVLGATPMDRPEDVEANPVTNRVYVCLTNNNDSTGSRSAGRTDIDFFRHEGNRLEALNTVTDASNPRGDFEDNGNQESDQGNDLGHIVEIIEDGDDNAAVTFTWNIFILCGPVAAGQEDEEDGVFLTNPDDLDEFPFSSRTTFYAGFPFAELISPMTNVDNITFDNQGNLVILTDGNPSDLDKNDGVWMCPTEGPTRGFSRQIFSSVVSSEVCGGEFTPDNTTLFLNIQHPGDSGSLTDIVSNFPFIGNAQPLPSLIQVFRLDGGVVGT